jgi:hypothetical protein
VEVISNKSIFDNPNIKTACVRAQRKSPNCYQQLLSDKVGLRMNVSIYEDSVVGLGLNNEISITHVISGSGMSIMMYPDE